MTEVRWRESPNQSSRRHAPIRFIILHADASPSETATIGWICNPKAEVSYHALIHRNGQVTRFVPDEMNAWHAGRSTWDGLVGLNRWSLGLAFANKNNGKEPLTSAQVKVAKRLIAEWRAKWPSIDAVLTHAQVSPGRKTDPERAPNFTLSQFQR